MPAPTDPSNRRSASGRQDLTSTTRLESELHARQARLGDRVTDQGGDCVIVPDDFPEGERFAEAFDGIGAVLRFSIE